MADVEEDVYTNSFIFEKRFAIMAEIIVYEK